MTKAKASDTQDALDLLKADHETVSELFDQLGEEIEEGRALFKSRVSPDLYHRNFYDRALVDILVKSKGHIKSKIW